MKSFSKKWISLALAFLLCMTPCMVFAESPATPESRKIPLTQDMVYDEQIAFYASNFFHSAKLVADENGKLPETCPTTTRGGNVYNLEHFVRDGNDAYVAGFDMQYTPYFYVDLGAYYVVTDVLLLLSSQNGVPGALYLGDHFNWTKICDLDYSKTAQCAVPVKITNYSQPTRYVRLNGGIRVLSELGIYGYKVAELSDEDFAHDNPSPYTGTQDNLTAGEAIGGDVFINNRRDAIEGLGNAREFHDLGFHLGDEGKAYFNPSAPSNKGQYNFDEYYGDLHSKGINIIPCLQLTHAWIYGDYMETKVDKDGNEYQVGFVYGDDKTNSPSYGGIATENAADYAKHANVLYNYAARYGSNKNVDPSTLSLADNQEAKVGLGYITTIENGNEQNANWWGEGRKSYMTPYEMAAQCSADYDGHEGTIPNAGVKSADPNMKLALAGLVGGNVLPYLDGLKKWFSYNRSDHYFALDVVNYHSYILLEDYASLTDAEREKYLGAPEYAEVFRPLLKNVRSWVDTNAPGRDVWVSEFNVYTDDLVEDWTLMNHNHEPRFQLGSSQRLLRAFMVALHDGADRLSMFQLRNEQSGTFGDMGLVWEYGNETKKLSWYFVSAAKNALLNADLVDSYESDNLYVYTFQDRETSEITYAVWSPTTDGSTIENYRLPVASGAEKAERIVPEYGYSEGEKSSLDITDGAVTLTVDETVQFIKVSGADVARDNYTVKKVGIDRIQLGPLSTSGSKAVYDGAEIVNVAAGETAEDPLLSEFGKIFDEQGRMPLSPYDVQIVEYTKDYVSNPNTWSAISLPHELSEFPYDMLVALDDKYTITAASVFDGVAQGLMEVYDDITGRLIFSTNLLETGYRVTKLTNYISTNRLRIVRHSAASVGELMLFGYPADSKVGVDVPKQPGELFVPDPDTFYVSFNSDGGSNISPIRGITPGSTITLPINPTKEGFVFGGWYVDKALTIPFNARDPITQNLVLNAKWMEKGQYAQIKLYPDMLSQGDVGLVDEQNCLDAGGKSPTSFGYTPLTILDLGLVYKMDQISFFDERGNGSFKVYGSTDGETWELLFDDPLEQYMHWTDYLLNGKEIRYLKIDKSNIVTELLVYGVPAAEVTDTYTLTFDAQGGSAPQSITGIAYGDTAAMPAAERYGYRFDGWYTLPSPKTYTEVTSDTAITANVTLYAKWVPTMTFTVDFKSCTDTPISSITGLGYGSTITLPTPVRDGFAFNGWYRDAAYTQPFAASTSITHNETLYAKWGSQLVLSQDMFLTGGSVEKLTDAQTGAGYGEEANPEEVKAQPYLIDLGAQRPVSSVVVWSGANSKGSMVKIKAGNSQDNMTEVYSGSILGNASKNTYAVNTTCRYVSVQLAHYMRELYLFVDTPAADIAYDINGGQGVAPGADRYCQGIDVVLPDSSGFQRTDYTFAGWALASDATEALAAYTATGSDVTLYAVWTENPKFILDAQSTEGGTAIGGGRYDPGATVTLTAVTADRNHRFVGWRNAAGEYVSRVPDYSFAIGGDLTLTAVFEALSYTVTLEETVGGTVQGRSDSYAPGEEIILRAVAGEGYHFDGWYAVRGGRDVLLSDMSILIAAADDNLHLKARFTADSQFTVRFLGKDGRLLSAYGAADGSALVLPDSDSVKVQGYQFAGWFTADGDEADASCTVTQDITLYARYTRGSQNYTVSVAGGSIGGKTSVSVPYDTVVMLSVDSAAIPKGMVFSHWEKDGQWISGQPNYFFAVYGSVSIRAVYAQEAAEAAPVIHIVKTEQADSSVYYTVERNIPEGFQLLEAGLLLTKNADSSMEILFADGAPDVVRIRSVFDKNMGATVQRVKTDAGTTLYARAYLRYADSQGRVYTVYSDVIAITVNAQ